MVGVSICVYAALLSTVLPTCSFCNPTRFLTQVGPYVCVLKTHVDVFDTWSPSYAEKLAALAEKHGKGG